MSKYSELVFMVNDLVKLISDDSVFTEDHIIYLLDTARSYLLKQKYENNAKNQIQDSNYQTIKVEVEAVSGMFGCCFGNSVQYRTKKRVPSLMNIGAIKIYTRNMFNYLFQFVSRDRFEFVGHNYWTRNLIYCTIGDDGRLYFKADNSCLKVLEYVYITGIFENASEIYEYSINDESCPVGKGISCNKLDNEFPIEEALIYNLIEIVVTKLVQAIYKPIDPKNNATDDLASIQQFIRNAMKDRFAKDYQS